MRENEVSGGFSLTPFGMNCSDDSADLRDGYLAKLINGTVRNGRVKTRPPFIERTLSFSSEYSENLFKNGRFQGCRVYESISSAVTVIGGATFLIDLKDYSVTSVFQTVGFMSKNVDRCYFLDSGRFFIIQDGVNLPIIFDRGFARRSNPDALTPYQPDPSADPLLRGEVPIGTHMAAGQGRIAVALPNSTEFVIGDITLPNDPSNILRFTETQEVVGGGSLQIPQSFGEITAMTFQSSPNTASGEGPLIVSGSRGMSWYNISLPRDEWQSNVMSKSITVTTGASSGDSVVSVNNDIIFVHRHRIQTLAQAVNDEQSIVSKPLSREVRCWMEHHELELDHMVYGMIHDNRYLCTVAPELVHLNDSEYADVQFKGLVVLDFERTSGLEQTNGPAYDGLWTGLNFTGLCSSIETDRGFIFSKCSTAGINKFHELDPVHEDAVFDNHRKAIQMRIFPKREGFQKGESSASILPKQFLSSSVWPSEVSGNTRINGYIRADDRRRWTPAGTANINSKHRKDAYSDEPFQNMKPQTRQRITLGGPNASVCDDETGKLASHGYGFETCIEVEGAAKIRTVVYNAVLTLDHSPEGLLCEEAEERVMGVNFFDDYEYDIEKAREI